MSNIRTSNINNTKWFIGKDVAKALGYKDTADALKKHVYNEDKLTRYFAQSGQNRGNKDKFVEGEDYFKVCASVFRTDTGTKLQNNEVRGLEIQNRGIDSI